MNSRRGWGLLVGFVVGGAMVCYDAHANAQVVPDTTLGAESSRVTSPNRLNFQIDGGATRGTNLFHSFSQFSVPTNGSAYFNNAPNIQNIFSRVTGGTVSNIDGLIAANGTANLFLLNPNGILFGPNARLNIGGSFVGTTANAIQFGDQGSFSASTPNMPSSLLMVNPSAFLFNQLASQPPNSIEDRGFLSVPASRSLLLVGGNVSPGTNSTGGILLNGGVLYAPGGRVELGGVTEAATVGLNVNGNDLSLTFPDNLARADVSLTNGAFVDVTGDKGSIAVNARNFEMSGGSVLGAGIGVGGTANSQAGDIEVDAQGAVNLKDGSLIFNTLRSGAMGKSGDVRINTGSLTLTNGAEVDAATFGRGNAGNVTISARDAVSFDGVSSNGDPSGVFSDVETGAVGQGGNVSIETGSLTLTNGAQVGADTFGQGNAGNVTISARDAVSFDGVSSNGLSSVAFSEVGRGAVGQGGNISIETGSIFIRNGAGLSTTTLGHGNAGDITIQARNTVLLDGDSNGFTSGILSRVGKPSDAGTEARGRGGNITIETDSLSVTNGADLDATTFGVGDAGNISIQAKNTVSFSGVNSNGIFSHAFSTVGPQAIGKGGDIAIEASSVSLEEEAILATSLLGEGRAGNILIRAQNDVAISGGAQLLADDEGQGDAGSIFIQAGKTVSLDGRRSSNGLSSSVFTDVTTGSKGTGGNIVIQTGSLSMTNGAELLASTEGQGNAGNINITARDAVSFDGVGSNGFSSGVFSTVDPGAVGQGGDVRIAANSLTITNGARISVAALGQGVAGNVSVNARTLFLDRGTLEATTASGDGGNIALQVGDLLLLRHGSLISTTAGTAQAGGNGGNITIDTPFIVAVPQENSDITANAYTGKGGSIDITTQGIFGTQYRPHLTPLSDITASSQFGVNGTVQINTPGVDPSRGLTDLTTAPVDHSKQIAQNCPARGRRQGSSFIITGNGGLPPRPGDPFTSPYPTGTVRGIPSSASSDPSTNPVSSTDTSNADRPPATPTIEEAQGWVYGPHGEIILTATAPTLTPQNAGLKPPTCPQS